MPNLVIYIHKISLLKTFVNPLVINLERIYKIHVFHINSLYDKTNIKTNYHCYDIGKKTLSDIQELIREIDPVWVMSLGFVSLNELLLVRICKQLNIKILYVEHGLISQDTIFYNKISFKPKFINQALIRNLHFLNNYFSFVIKSNSSLQELKVLYGAKIKHNFDGFKFTKAIFFSKESFTIINSLFKYNKGEYIINGFPIVQNSKDLNLIKLGMGPNGSEGKYVLYIHQPFIFDGLVPINYDEEKEYLLQLAEMVKLYECELIILIHPREDTENYRTRFQGTPIKISDGVNKVDLIAKSKFVLGHYSSLLILASFLGKQIVEVPYPKLNRNFRTLIQGEVTLKSINELRSKEFSELVLTKCKNESGNRNQLEISSFEELAKNIIDIINN